MSTKLLEQAVTSTRGVLVDVSAEQMSAPSPCASWTVQDIVNHVIGGQYFFAAALTGDAAGSPPASGDDVVAAFDLAAAASTAAFSSDGAMDQMVTLPFGQMPGAMVVRLAATDTFVHGWDIAKATGQSTDLDPVLAADLLEGAKAAIGPQMRGADGVMPFGPEREAPGGAPAADQLAAFLGRDV
jgi:uncharacterized protein (TIGR03086 family)